MYTYKAETIRVVDGDTIRFRIDLGFRMSMETNCRLHGINAKELNAQEFEDRIIAKDAKEFIENILEEGDYVTLHSKNLDKYGRPVVIVEISRGETSYMLNEKLVKKGFAVKMEGY